MANAILENKKVSISTKNDKMGRVHSVSLPPVTTCKNWQRCMNAKGDLICYAVRMYKNKHYGSIKKAYDRNLEILQADRKSYFLQIQADAMLQRFFRWHVSGDIIDIDYLDNMVKIARSCKGTTFMAFTKNYEDVNEYLTSHKLPKNLKR